MILNGNMIVFFSCFCDAYQQTEELFIGREHEFLMHKGQLHFSHHFARNLILLFQAHAAGHALNYIVVILVVRKIPIF